MPRSRRLDQIGGGDVSKSRDRAWECPGGHTVKGLIKIQGKILPCVCGANQGEICKLPSDKTKSAVKKLEAAGIPP